jgi:hypothetical protein
MSRRERDAREEERKHHLPIDYLLWTTDTLPRGPRQTEKNSLTLHQLYLWRRYTSKDSKGELFPGYLTKKEKEKEKWKTKQTKIPLYCYLLFRYKT